MHDLEREIAAWRARMMKALRGQEETVLELEGHLREEIARLRAEGLGESEAFTRSVARLGDGAAIAREFERVSPPWLPASRPVLVMLTILAAVMVLMFVVLGMSYRGGLMSLLLVTHAGIIGAGYLIVCGTGLVGMCTLLMMWRRPLSGRERRELRRLMFRLNIASAVLVPVGMVLGMVYAARAWGSAWSWAPVELGALLVLATTMLSLVAQLLGGLSERVVTYLAVMAFFVVQFGWYGVKALTPVVPVMWLCLALFVSQAALVALNWRRGGEDVDNADALRLE